MPLPERLVAEYFAASDPLSRCESFRGRGLAQRQHRGPESLLITAGATCAPAPWLMLDELPVLRVISSREVRITGTRE